MKVQTQSAISLLAGFAVMFGVVGASYAQPITELFDFVNQRDEVEWRDLNENVVALEGSESDRNLIQSREI